MRDRTREIILYLDYVPRERGGQQKVTMKEQQQKSLL